MSLACIKQKVTRWGWVEDEVSVWHQDFEGHQTRAFCDSGLLKVISEEYASFHLANHVAFYQQAVFSPG